MPRRQDQPELLEEGEGHGLAATDHGTESSIEEQSPDTVIAAGGVSLLKAVRALGLARRGRTREAKASRLAYQESIGVLLFVVLLSAAVELVLVDIVLSVLWVRLPALTLGLLAVFGMLAFIVALRAYPHRIVKGTLTIHYGACFELAVPLELVETVTERKVMSNQKPIAEVTDGVLSVPVMGLTNLVIALSSPIKVHLRKSGISTVREIRVFAVEPGPGVLKLRNGGATRAR